MVGDVVVRVAMHVLVEGLGELEHCTGTLVHRRKGGTWLVCGLI